MKNRTWLILLITIVFSLTYTSCTKSDSVLLLGNWSVAAETKIPRTGAVAFTIGTDGYMGCGYNGVKTGAKMLNDFWKYTSNTGEGYWSQVDNFPGPARLNASTFVIDGIGYVTCGYNITTFEYYKDLYSFDPSQPAGKDLQWKKLEDLPDSARYGAVSFALDHKGYVGCGLGSDGAYRNDFWQYDPATNSWKVINTFSGQTRAFGASFVIGDNAYVVSGGNAALAYDFYVFEKSTGEFRKLRNIRPQSSESYDDDYTDIIRNHGVGCSANGKGYLVCGIVGGSISNSVWEYDPTYDQWDRKNTLEGASRIDPFAFSTTDNRIFVGTGSTSGDNKLDLGDLWEFKPLDIYNQNY